jgi:hypothetical protein
MLGLRTAPDIDQAYDEATYDEREQRGQCRYLPGRQITLQSDTLKHTPTIRDPKRPNEPPDSPVQGVASYTTPVAPLRLRQRNR